MSQKKSAARRLSLLAGSSLVAASLAGFGGLALTPSAALAANECQPLGVDPTANGATADAYSCPAGTYANGITYSSSGALGVTMVANGATVNSTITNNGINLTGNGADSVTFNSQIGTLTAGAGTNGPLLDVTTATGAISITTGAMTANTVGTTHAIRATSTGNGAITINRVGTGAVNATAVGATAAIEATTNGGAINITTTGGTTGRLRGILAQTSGTGAITLNIGNSVAANNIDGLAAIDTVAGTGITRINITGGTVNGGAGAAIRSVSASTSATGAVNVQNTGGTVNGRVDFSGVSAGGVTFNNTGASGTTGRWTTSGTSTFSGFGDTLIMSGTGLNTAADGTVLNFGAGTDTFDMGARFAVNGVVTLSNLEAFNHSGVTYMGGTTGTATDGAADDVLRMTSGTFTGSGDSRVVMDVSPFIAQAGCETLTGGGDCLDLRGATTAGVTLLTINDITTSVATMGGFDPVGVTLVDVGGGSSAAGHFVLDPDSANYGVDPVTGAMISRPGLFGFSLRYDPETQRHNLVGLPRSPVMEYAMLPSAARSIWYMTSKTITDRQTDLREGSEGTVWLRATGEYSKRDMDTALELAGDDFVFDNSYKLYAGTIIGGMDLIAGTSAGYDYVLGAQLGYVGSSFDLNASESSGRMTGATGGVYASVWNRGFFLDTTFNTDFLTLDYDSPVLGSKTNTWLRSVGARAEAGMRYGLGERMYVEPLAAAAFVYTTFEELSLAGGEVHPDDAQSRRAALGLRVGADYPGQSVNWSYFLTGRAWNEFDGESRGVVRNPGTDLTFADDFSGTFSEFEAGLSLANAAGTLSGFLTSGVKAQDGYSAVDLSTGLRLRW